MDFFFKFPLSLFIRGGTLGLIHQGFYDAFVNAIEKPIEI